MPIPTGEVTLLFTDVEGSTRKWEEHPDAMGVALPRHDEILRQAIEARGGFVFKTVGDAFCAAFSGAGAAAEAALAGQQALAVESWPEPITIRVRMGLHSGTCSERDGDYFGPTVNRTARLAATAYGGQTVVSAATAVLLRPSLPDGVSMRDLGEHRLKDLGQPEWVFQLSSPGLQQDFPPLRSLSHPQLRHNLPAQFTSFIGRSRQLAEIRSLRTTNRLVTLTGSGGAGKTRLALQAAADDVDDSGSEVWLVELAPVRETELVVARTAEAVGVREEPGRPLLGVLVDALRTRRALLVLDNCEHLVTACAELSETLLRSCLDVSILATSREPLGVPGEQVFRVPSLSVPTTNGVDGDISESESVQLFVDRARQQLPDFEPTGDVADAMASICRQLDGIPLALELAAASLRRLSAVEIAERLDNRFRLLTGGSRTAMPRQQTLRATVDWSFELLNPAEQRTLSRLSVFVDGWSLAASEQVCAMDDVQRDDVIEVLGSLVDKSLVQTESIGSATRYRLLETIRHYAAEKLLGYSEEEVRTARAAHARFFVRYVESRAGAAETALYAGGPMDWLDQVDLERSNIRAMVRHSLGEDVDTVLVQRVVVALRRFWQVRGDVAEGLEFVEEALAYEAAPEPTTLRAATLLVAGDLLQVGGHFSAAIEPLTRGLDVARNCDDDLVLIDLVSALCLVAAIAGELETARWAGLEAVERARRQDDPCRLGTALDYQSVAFTMLGDEASARANSAEALALFRAAGAPLGMALVLMHSSILEMAAGDLSAARARLAQALDFAFALRADGLISYLTINLAVAQLLDGESEAAEQSFERCLAEALRVGNRSNTAHAVLGLALCALGSGDEVASARLLGAADGLMESSGAPWGAIEATLSEDGRQRLREALGSDVLEANLQAGRLVEPADLLRSAPDTRQRSTSVS
jgi:predicted ATPase/class 3 adenylate cyclase